MTSDGIVKLSHGANYDSAVENIIARLKNQATSIKDFGECINTLSVLLAQAALKKSELEKKSIESPLGETIVNTINQTDIILVPVLRAGVGMVKGVRSIIPEAEVGVVGLKRQENLDSKEPEQYMVDLPEDIRKKKILVLDPMLATAGSICRTVELLLERGANEENIKLLHILAAPEGIQRITKKFPNLKMIIAALGHHLNNEKYIVPGFGDAGQRIFGDMTPAQVLEVLNNLIGLEGRFVL